MSTQQIIDTLDVIFSANGITLIFTFIAIIISIFSLKESKKGAVLEHCLTIFGKTNEIYQQCSKLLEIKNVNNIIGIKEKMAYTILPFYSEQQKIAIRIIKRMAEDSSYIADDELGTQYANLYVASRDYNFLEKCEIFCSGDIFESVQKLYNWYDTFQLDFILLTKDEIIQEIGELKDIIKEFENKNILKKLKKKIVIP